MKKALVALAGMSLLVAGCGSDGGGGDDGSPQSELADLLVAQDVGFPFDEDCVRDKTAELSDDEAQFLVDNIDATDTETFSPELQRWAEDLLECADIAADTEPPDVTETDDTETDATDETGDADVTETDATDGTTPDTADPNGSIEGSSSSLTSIARSGLSTYESIGETWATVGASVESDTDTDLYFVEVTFNFLSADGTPVATESSYIDVLPAGEMVPVVGSTSTDLTPAMPVTVEVTAFAEEESFFETEWVEMELGPDVVIAEGEFSTTLSGTVTNPSDTSIDFVSIECLLVSDDGTVLGGARAFPNTTAPGQTTAWETSGPDIEAAVAAGATGAECRSIAPID